MWRLSDQFIIPSDFSSLAGNTTANTLSHSRRPTIYPALAESQTVTICAEKVILSTCIRYALAAFDGDCQTIALRECDSIHELRCISLPSSDSLELDGRAAKFIMRRRPKTRPWNGDAVTITNSHSSCISSVHFLLAIAVPYGPASPR